MGRGIILKRERIKPVIYEEVKDLVIYDESSPSYIIWATPKCNNSIKPSSPAGCLTRPKDNDGVWIVGLNKKQHKVHRIIYSIVHKTNLTDEDYVIHLDGNSLNNRVDNLKKVTIDRDNQLCTKCGEIKPKKFFSKNSALSKGVSIYCVDCTASSVANSKYDVNFTDFVEYDEDSETKLKRVYRKSLNGITIQKQCGSIKNGYIVINHNKYSLVKVILALHGIFVSENESIKFKDGDTRNLSITNLEVTTKLKVVKEKTSKEYKERVRTNDSYKKERRMWRSAKERAKKQDLVFDIDFRDIVIPEFCPILGFRLQQGSGKAQASSPSLDRIDPNKGYIKENIQVISYKANTMKNDASVEMLLNFAKWVNNEYN